MDGPPPPPPKHGENPKTTGGTHAPPGSGSGLPPGNYDIFIIPPHSSGGGFVYLPSLQVQRNSFIAGIASTLASIAVWKVLEPQVKQYCQMVTQGVSSGGNGVILLVVLVGVAGWVFGQTQSGGKFGAFGPGSGPQGATGTGAGAGTAGAGAGYQHGTPPPNGSFPGAGGSRPQSGSWGGYQQHGASSPPPEDAESTFKKEQAKAEEERKRAEEDEARKKAESKRKEDEAKRAKEEADRKRAEEERRKRDEEERRQAEAQRRRAEEEARRLAEEAKKIADEVARKAAWEELKRAEEARKKREEEEKAKEEAAKQARAKAEKEKWEKMRQREREQREREARERLAKEKAKKLQEQREKEDAEREAREAAARAAIEKEIREKLEAEQKAKAAEEAARKAEDEKAAAEAAAAKEKAAAEAAALKARADAERAERLKAARERAQRDREARLKAEADKIKAEAAAAAVPDPSAGRRSTTYGGIGGGERLDPYAGARSPPIPSPSVTSTHSSPIKATVSPKKNYEKPTAKSYFGTEARSSASRSHVSSAYSESSYAESISTARTTPPPSQRGPYSTADPNKIIIKAVYLFNDLFPKPVAQLVASVGKVTDGLVLKIQSEGLFIDDDVRSIPQREWDVKAWTLKLVETGTQPSKGLHILRASVRDTDGKKYVFLIDESESWKLALGLQRLRKGSQVRSLQNSQMAPNDVIRLLNTVPPLS
ncbi:hypothetical protein N0V86_007445 [Didymella sp. IMI 355093]|nr:hypothetical protein N0V86_007445 [Didymella sp. IMI 355093]